MEENFLFQDLQEMKRQKQKETEKENKKTLKQD